jgi:hypothetical protein
MLAVVLVDDDEDEEVVVLGVLVLELLSFVELDEVEGAEAAAGALVVAAVLVVELTLPPLAPELEATLVSVAVAVEGFETVGRKEFGDMADRAVALASSVGVVWSSANSAGSPSSRMLDSASSVGS